MTAALTARGVPDPTPRLAAELGVLAMKQGFAAWADGDRDDAEALAGEMRAALGSLRHAAATLG